MKSLDDLPDEIIIEIFKFLHHFDRKSIRAVSNRFHRIAWDPVLTSDDLICLRNVPIEENEFNFKNINLYIQTDYIKNYQKSNFLEVRGERVKYLFIQYSTSDFNKFWNSVFKYVPNVEELIINFYGYDTKFILKDNETFSLQNLRKLSIYPGSDPTYISPISKLQIKNLESFLIICGQYEMDDMYNQIENYEQLFDEPLLKILGDSKDTLQSLALDSFDCGVISEFYLKSLKKVGPQLNELYSVNTYINQGIIEAVSSLFPNLSKFYFEENREEFEYLHSKVPKLCNVKIPYYHESFDPSILINKTQYMSHLKLEEISSDILNIFRNNVFVKVTRLTLGPNICRNEDIETILSHTPNVNILATGGVTGCDLQINNQTIIIISKYCPKIRLLTIYGNADVTDVSPLNSLKGLLILNVVNCENLENEGVSELTLPELRRLEIHKSKITEKGVRSIVNKCLALRFFTSEKKFSEDFHDERSRGLLNVKCSQFYDYRRYQENFSEIRSFRHPTYECE